MSAHVLWDVVFLSAHPVIGLGTVAILVGLKIHLEAHNILTLTDEIRIYT